MQQRSASLLAAKRTAYTRIGVLLVILLLCGVPSLIMAQEASPPTLEDLGERVEKLEELPDSGDTAWMLTSTALVLFMTIPGLALFYGGLVRVQNVLSVLMQCFALTGLITIIWIICGYSLAFNTAGMEAGKITLGSFVGGLGTMFLRGVGVDSLSGTIPETVFITFQLTFAIITPALIAGAFAERMKFSAMLIFSILWSIIVYAPLCHMAWSGDGSLFGDIIGALDFAGGNVVHINAGSRRPRRRYLGRKTDRIRNLRYAAA